jgi:hypothetical protein
MQVYMLSLDFKFVSIQPEISYTTKGAELTYNNAFATGTQHSKQTILKFLYSLF